RAGGDDLGGVGLRVGGEDRYVLGGVFVGERQRRLPVGGDDRQAVVGEGLGQDVRPFQAGEETFDLRFHLLDQVRIGGHQHGRGVGAVFRLAQEVHCHQRGVGSGVGQHQHLGGTGGQVDGAGTEHLQLGGGYPGVPGADDLVHRLHRLGAVGQGGYRLGAAHGPHLGGAGEPAGGQHDLRDRAVGRLGGGDDGLGDAGDAGGHDGRDRRRRLRRLASRHVGADTSQGRPGAGDLVARGGRDLHLGGQLGAVELLDGGDGGFQGVAHPGVEGGDGGFELGVGDASEPSSDTGGDGRHLGVSAVADRPTYLR